MRSVKSTAIEILMVVICFGLFLGLWQWFDGSFEGWADLLSSMFFFAIPYTALVFALRSFNARRTAK